MTRNARHVAAVALSLAALLLAGLYFILKLFALFLLSGILMSLSAGLFYKHLANIALTISSVLFALFLGETWELVNQRHATPEAQWPAGYSASGKFLGGNPGRHRVSKRSSKGQIIYDVTYSIGDDHFRITPQSHKGVRSVYFLGCSFMFGEGLEDDQTLPFYFGQLNPDVAVKNYGFHGYGMSQSLIILDQRIHDNGALIVVQTAPWHAFRSACIPAWTLGAPKFIIDSQGKLVRTGTCAPLLWTAANVPILKHSQLYRALVLPALERIQWSSQKWLDLYLAIIRETKHITDSRSQRLLIAFIGASAADAAVLGSSNEQILQSIRGMGIDVVDVTLSPTIESQSMVYFLHPEDHHPSAAANRRRAEILSGHLSSLGLR